MTAAHALRVRLPDTLAAAEPPEARGLARDEVRLLVSRIGEDTIVHTRFRAIADFLEPGDLLVVNTSATIKAALPARRVPAGQHGTSNERTLLHLSTPLSTGHWVVELRRMTSTGHAPMLDARAGEQLELADGAVATLIEPFAAANVSGADAGSPASSAPIGGVRLWVAELRFPGGVLAFAEKHGSPIRYSYTRGEWPIGYYQTIFAAEPGSVEMPSAGRGFTLRSLEQLAKRGVVIAPIVLHTGVASLEADEPPYPERYRVPRTTADAVNRTHTRGGRVVAVGTTVARALETVAGPSGRIHAHTGWTDLVVTPERGMRTVDGLLTGFHEPHASHLRLLEGLAGPQHIGRIYEAARSHGYLWHEFGDLHLILP